MLHRATIGSFERFIGILIEHYEGRLPLWLAPVQAVLLNITDKHASYVEEVAEIMQNSGLRTECDLRNEKIGFKIREWTLERVPYLLVAGEREVANREVAVRTRNGKDLGTFSIDDIQQKLLTEVASRANSAVEE